MLVAADAAATAAQGFDHVLLHILSGIEGGHGAMDARQGGCGHDGRTLSEDAAGGQAAFLALLLVIVVSMSVIDLVQQLLALDKEIQAHVGGCGRYNLAIGQLKVAHIRFGIQAAIDDNYKRKRDTYIREIKYSTLTLPTLDHILKALGAHACRYAGGGTQIRTGVDLDEPRIEVFAYHKVRPKQLEGVWPPIHVLLRGQHGAHNGLAHARIDALQPHV